MSTPSVAAQIIVSIIPIVGIVMGCTVIFFYLLWNYKLKVHLIRNGLYTKPEFDIILFSLLAGLILFTLGLALVVFFIIKYGFSFGVLSGLIPFAIGAGLIIFSRISYNIKSQNDK